MPFFGTPRASTSPGEEGVPLSPYMGTGATPTNRGASLTGRYCEYCAGVGVRPDPSVLVFLRLSLSELAVRPHQTAKRSERSRFGDTDLFALCDFLLTEQPDAVFWGFVRDFNVYDQRVALMALRYENRKVAAQAAKKNGN